jgi:hypothetical protein
VLNECCDMKGWVVGTKHCRHGVIQFDHVSTPVFTTCPGTECLTRVTNGVMAAIAYPLSVVPVNGMAGCGATICYTPHLRPSAFVSAASDYHDASTQKQGCLRAASVTHR